MKLAPLYYIKVVFYNPILSYNQYNAHISHLSTLYAVSVKVGLPNLTGDKFLVKATTHPVGLLKNTGTRAANNGEGFTGVVDYATFDASRWNSIYGSSDTVTPNSLSCLYIISY